MTAEKVIRDGKMAVLYSPGFGAGWYTWNSGHKDMLFDPELVAAVEAGDQTKMLEVAERKWPDAYKGGLDDRRIAWLPEGTAFRIHEYDGSESVETYADIDLVA